MFNLVQIFLRLSGLFVFLILEVICFTLVVKKKQSQQAIYDNSIVQASGIVEKATSGLSDYFSLDDENYRIARENTRLMERINR